MPLKRKISADEAQAKRKDHMRETDRGMAVLKASKGPPSWDSDSRTARFIMTSQGGDRYGDVVVTDGGDTTEFERNPVGLLFHNSDLWPVAKWANLEKILKGRPPRLEGDFILLPAGGPIPEIDQTAWMIENNGIRACSIGFVPDWDTIEPVLDAGDNWTGGIIFNKWELVECSVCAVPANPDALIKMAKGDMNLAKDLIEDVLDNWHRTPEGLLIPRAEFEKAYRITVEKIAADRQTNPSQPPLPTTDEEILAADRRNLEFEVAKICPPTEGLVVAVDGDKSAKLVVEEGKMKHAGEWTAGDVANVVVTAKTVGDKTTYEVTQPCSKGMKLNDKKEWEPIPETAAATAEVAEKEEVGNLTVKVDTTELRAEVGKLSGMFDGFAETINKIFGKQKTEERVEPKVDAPPAPPSADVIAAAKAAAAQVSERAARHLAV